MSKVIKPGGYVSLEQLKKIDIIQPTFHTVPSPMTLSELETAAMDEQVASMKQQILRDAESYAEEQVRLALEESERLKRLASEEIESWWKERRSQDEILVQELQQQGFAQGLSEGRSQSEADVRSEYENMLSHARHLLQEAHEMKERIIQEAEPFLLELSCSIAAKIVQHELTVSPDSVIDLIRKSLTRRREQGLITLCVSPEQYQFVLDAKEELVLALDSQAELQILPDASVQDFGCVVRSSFGSIDARINTQLTEIKSALQQIAARNEDV